MLGIISQYLLQSYLDYLRYLDIYNHINSLTFKCNTNTIREVYCMSSDKSNSIEMCNNHESRLTIVSREAKKKQQ